jgi:hypothetical protein
LDAAGPTGAVILDRPRPEPSHVVAESVRVDERRRRRHDDGERQRGVPANLTDEPEPDGEHRQHAQAEGAADHPRFERRGWSEPPADGGSSQPAGRSHHHECQDGRPHHAAGQQHDDGRDQCEDQPERALPSGAQPADRDRQHDR